MKNILLALGLLALGCSEPNAEIQPVQKSIVQPRAALMKYVRLFTAEYDGHLLIVGEGDQKGRIRFRIVCSLFCLWLLARTVRVLHSTPPRLSLLDKMLEDGEISQKEYNLEMRELERSYQRMAEQSAQDAYDREYGRWN